MISKKLHLILTFTMLGLYFALLFFRALDIISDNLQLIGMLLLILFGISFGFLPFKKQGMYDKTN